MPRAKQANPMLAGAVGPGFLGLQDTMNQRANISQNRMLEAMAKKGEYEGAGYANLGAAIGQGAEAGAEMMMKQREMNLANWNAMQERELRRELSEDAQKSAERMSRKNIKSRREEARLDREHQDKNKREDRAYDQIQIESDRLMQLKLWDLGFTLERQSLQQGHELNKSVIEMIKETQRKRDNFVVPVTEVGGRFSRKIETNTLDDYTKEGAGFPSINSLDEQLTPFGVVAEDIADPAKLKSVLTSNKGFEATATIVGTVPVLMDHIDELLLQAKQKAAAGVETKGVMGPHMEGSLKYQADLKKRMKKDAELHGTSKEDIGFFEKTFRDREWYEYTFRDEEADEVVQTLQSERELLEEIMDTLKSSDISMSKEKIAGVTGTGQTWSGTVGQMVNSFLKPVRGISSGDIATEIVEKTTDIDDMDTTHASVLEMMVEELTQGATFADPKTQKLYDEMRKNNKFINRMRKVWLTNIEAQKQGKSEGGVK